MKVYILLFLLVISFFSCSKDEINDNLTSSPSESSFNVEFVSNSQIQEQQNQLLSSVVSSLSISSSLFITVKDVDGVLLDDVIVTLENFQKNTINGYVTFEDIDLNQDFVGVKFEKQGYISAIKNFTPSDSGLNTLDVIMFLPETKRVGSNGGFISFSSNVSLDFPSNSFLDQNGQIYTDDVYVNSFYHHSDNQNYTSAMPGALVGLNSSGELEALLSEGMLTIDIFDGDGNELVVNSLSSVLVKMPASIDSPSQIKLWHLNENFGIWVESGIANKVDGFYEFEVSHFSTYNLDYSVDSVDYIDFQVKDDLGQFIPNQIFEVYHEGVPIKRVTTDLDGFFSFVKAPIGEYSIGLVLCDAIITSDVVNVTSAGDFDLIVPDFSNHTSALDVISLEGWLVNCEGDSPYRSSLVEIIIEEGTTNELRFITNLSTSYEYLAGYGLVEDGFEYVFNTCGLTFGDSISVKILHLDDDRYDMVYTHVSNYNGDIYSLDPDFTCLSSDSEKLNISDDLYDVICPGFSCLLTEDNALDYTVLDLYSDNYLYSIDLQEISFYFKNLKALYDYSAYSYYNVDSLINLKFLEELYLGGYFDEGLDKSYFNLGQITTLKQLTFSLYTDSDISFLSTLVNLTYLQMTVVNLSDLSSLNNMVNLTELNLRKSGLTNLSTLPSLDSLTSLDLWATSLNTLEGMPSLMNLTDLNISNTNIVSLSGLPNLPKLKNISLNYNNITDLTPLYALVSLETINLYGVDSATEDQINALKQNLPGVIINN